MDYELEPDARVTALADTIAERLHELALAPREDGILPLKDTLVEVANGREALAVAIPAPPNESTGERETVRSRALQVPTPRLYAIAGLVAAAGLVSLALALRNRATENARAEASGQITAVALVPFRYIGQDSADAYLAKPFRADDRLRRVHRHAGWPRTVGRSDACWDLTPLGVDYA